MFRMKGWEQEQKMTVQEKYRHIQWIEKTVLWFTRFNQSGLASATEKVGQENQSGADDEGNDQNGENDRPAKSHETPLKH